MKTVLKFIPVILVAVGCLASTAQANTGAAFMTLAGPTSPPIGHYEFCRRLPGDCSQRAATADPMVLTPARWQTLLDVNYQVNSTIRPETDMQVYGKPEYWNYPTTAGDCEDYALLKRKFLIEHGFPVSDLLMTVVLQPNGDGHAVLTVHTDRGDFILDNMRQKVLLWSDTEYTYVKRQSSLNDARWDKISDGHPALVGSVR